jgi:alanine dehydrogenase
MTYEKHEIHITCSNEKAWIDDCVLKCKNLCEKAYETQMKKDLVSIQGFYNPNVSLSLFVEHVYYHTDILSGKIK